MADFLQQAHAALHARDWQRAESCCAEILRKDPDHVEALWVLAQVLLSRDASAEAIPVLQHLSGLVPEDPRPAFQIGHVLKSIGSASDARAAFLKALTIDPGNLSAIVSLTQVTRYAERNDEVLMIERRYQDAPAGSAERRHLAFALGKVFDDIGDYDGAFRYIAEGNRIASSQIASTVADDENMFASITACLDADFAARYRRIGNDDPMPIFVFGMPRSGTTLVHQIIGSHPDAFGAGELPYMQGLVEKLTAVAPSGRLSIARNVDDATLRQLTQGYLQALGRLAGTASRVVDKGISNLLFAGFIGTVLPGATLISCRRDPRDVCLSIFRRDIPEQEYGYDLTRLGRNYQLYVRLLEHWEVLLPGRIVTVSYEELVTEPEPTIRCLIEQCGLPFDASCLDFHRSRDRIRTQSALQVREPIHGSAIGQWRHYERHLTPLLQLLDSGAG